MPATQSTTLHFDIANNPMPRTDRMSERASERADTLRSGHGSDPNEAAQWHRLAQDGDVAQWRNFRLMRYERRGDRDYEWRACPTCGEQLARAVRIVQVEYAVTVQVGQPGTLAASATTDARLSAVDWTADPVTFGNVLRRRREMARLTRVELASRAGVADSTIRNIEMGRHRATRFTIACLLGVKELSLGLADEAALAPAVTVAAVGSA